MDSRSFRTRAAIALIATAVLATGVWAISVNGHLFAPRRGEPIARGATPSRELQPQQMDEAQISRRVALLERQLALANARLASEDKTAAGASPDPAETPRTPEQLRAAAEAQDQAYEQRFALLMAAEPADERLTSETLRNVRETLSVPELSGASVDNVECRTSVCKMAIRYGEGDPGMSNQIQQRLAGQLIDGMAAWFHPQGPNQLTAYFVRADKAPFRAAAN